MIRINLLDHLPAPAERLQAMLNPGRAGGFISRRETVLGGLFLLLAFSILGTQFWLSQEPPQDAIVESPPARPAAKPAPKPVAKPPSETDAEEAAAAFARLPPARPATLPPPAAGKPPEVPKPELSSKPASTLASGSKLTAVNVTPLEDGVDIFLPIQGKPDVRSFRVDNPKRVAFDIPGAILDIPREQSVQRIESEWVTRVRAAQNALDPPLVRVVLEAPEFPAVKISVSEMGVAIRVRQP